ncbi:hypothetical protein HID58_081451 [Brassica napus]|uniref:Uncharacterized protein n=1 Tax=Brassica napus TaxID=3708 RepID=A0ABQ7YAY6_BRANA|nr:hypothetical protein HID58_081451 [Brassica napus]
MAEYPLEQGPASISLKLLTVIHLYREDEESSRIDGEQGMEERSSRSTGRRFPAKPMAPSPVSRTRVVHALGFI